MKLRLALFAALATTAGMSMAQTTVLVPVNTYVIETAPSVRTSPGITNSPNSNKAQNSDMRTQAGMHPYYVYPTAEYPLGIYMYPAGMYPAGMYQPTASTRSPGITNTPNPNKTQNSGVPQQ